MRVITLLTDFGDFYHGVMKGVILNCLGEYVQIIDISNSVESQNVFQGAFLLFNSYKYFPRKTVHVAVVDPGVGGKRDAIVVESNNYFFVGPDNGILYPSCAEDGIRRIWRINPSKLGTEISSTFHGRDIFAPVISYVLRNELEKVAIKKRKMKELNIFDYEVSGNRVKCRVVFIDKFGNIITNLRKELVEKVKPKFVVFKGLKIPVVKTYCEVGVGKPLALIGSFNTLEISIRNGNASKKFKVKNGKIEFELE